MGASRSRYLRAFGHLILLGLLAAPPASAGLPGAGPYPRFHGGYGYGGHGYGYGYRGYGYPGRFYGWHGWGPGYYFPVLPVGCLALSFGGAAWYYGGGYWYRPSGVGFVLDLPPVGLVVPVLPPGCTTLVLGGVTYYCANDVYYTAVPSGQGYVVAAPPPGAATPAPPPGSPDAAALEALVIIPRNGQKEAQILADRRDAQAFASRQARYDPAHSDPAAPGTPRARQAYLRAMKAYLESHGYTVD
jgi:hypothetical protein